MKMWSISNTLHQCALHNNFKFINFELKIFDSNSKRFIKFVAIEMFNLCTLTMCACVNLELTLFMAGLIA